MVVPGVALFLVFLVVAEVLILWVGEVVKARREVAYWAARDNRPPLYDWEELGL